MEKKTEKILLADGIAALAAALIGLAAGLMLIIAFAGALAQFNAEPADGLGEAFARVFVVILAAVGIVYGALAVLFSLGFGAFAVYLLADAKNGFARVRRGRKKFIFFGVVKSVLAAGLIIVLFAQGVNALFIAAAAISAACAVPDFMAARQIGKENAAAKENAET